MSVVALLAVALSAAPLTLDDALALAAKRNPELQLSRADAEAAGANVRLSYGGVLPRLDLGLRLGGQRRREPGVPTTTSGEQVAELDLTQPLFNGLASWNTISAQRTREAAARRQLEEVTLRVAFGVTRAFYEVVKQRHALEVRRGTADLSAELVKRADALFTAGRGTKADTYSARANFENDRIAVQAQEAVLEQARANLAATIGLGSDIGLDVVPPFPVAGPELPQLDEPPPLPNLLAQARKERPLVAALRLSEEAAQTDVTVAEGAWWPSLALHGNLTRGATPFSDANGVFAGPSNQYVATGEVTLTWNLYAGGSTAAGVSLARTAASRAEASLAQGEETVAAEVAIARAQVAALARAASALRPLLEASENALRFARELLDVGRSSQLEVRDASLKVEQARLVWVTTTVDLVVARADLARAMGTRR
jgi:outer membrane protein